MSTSSFEVRNTPNKGRGLFALQNIPKGGIILVEKVLALYLYMDKDDSAWMDPAFWAELKRNEETPGFLGFGEIGRLAREYIEEATAGGFDVIQELRGAHPEFQDRLVDIFFTNRLRLSSGLSCMGLGRHSSIINHACIPNAHLSGDNDKDSDFRMIAWVKATKDIAAGEEITISYLELSCEQESRRRFTFAYFNFICACDMCEALDPRREAMIFTLGRTYQTIDGSTDISSGAAEPWIFFRNAASIERILRELNLTDRRVAELWLDCGFVAAHHSDAVRARYFFRNAAAWYQNARPADCIEVEELTHWANMPTTQSRWGRTNLGASDLLYDPILDGEELHTETLGLVFMTDYRTGEYRRIAAGADRDLSGGAQALIRQLSPYYTAKMEADAKRIQAEAESAAFEAAEQRAQANMEALIAEVEREKHRAHGEDIKSGSKPPKKAKKRQKKKDGDAKAAATSRNDAIGVESNLISKKDHVQSPVQSELAETMDTKSAVITAKGGWETVTNKKGKNAKGKGKQTLTEVDIASAEKSENAHSTQNKASRFHPAEQSKRAAQNSSVSGGAEWVHEMVDPERTDNKLHQPEEAEPPSAERKEEQVCTDPGIANTDLAPRVSPVVIPVMAAENTNEFDSLKDRAELPTSLQAPTDPTLGRPHARSCAEWISPVELELEITGLQEGIRIRKAKIQKLEEEIKDMEHELDPLKTAAIRAVDLEEVEADLKADPKRLGPAWLRSLSILRRSLDADTAAEK
jgi:hypothetical protein